MTRSAPVSFWIGLDRVSIGAGGDFPLRLCSSPFANVLRNGCPGRRTGCRSYCGCVAFFVARPTAGSLNMGRLRMFSCVMRPFDSCRLWSSDRGDDPELGLDPEATRCCWGVRRCGKGRLIARYAFSRSLWQRSLVGDSEEFRSASWLWLWLSEDECILTGEPSSLVLEPLAIISVTATVYRRRVRVDVNSSPIECFPFPQDLLFRKSLAFMYSPASWTVWCA